jgi:hypothetical protein
MLFMGAVGLWGMFAFLRGRALEGSISGALLIGQGLVALQVAMGVVLYVGGYRSSSVVHYLYGVTAVLVLPFVWTYARERHPRQSLFFYSLTALFIAGLAIRGTITAS